jgi:flagellar biosynthetic protein FliR
LTAAPAIWPGGLTRLLLAGGLGAARAIPITVLVPAFGGPQVALALRIGLGLILALLGFPRLSAGLDGAGLDQAGPLLLGLLLAREISIGATVGLVVSFAFRAAEAAGMIGDVLRGANQAELLDPASGERASPTGQLYRLVATVIFLELGGLGRLAAGLARSYDAIPIGAGAGAAVGTGLARIAQLVTVASARLVESAVALAAPLIVASLLADVALGAIARLAPPAPIHFAAMPLRALRGVGVVLIGLGALDAALVTGLPGWITLAERGFGLWRR